MEEHFILRVPPSVAERLNSLLGDHSESPEDESIDLSFCDGRTGKFKIGKDEFEVSLVDLPCVVESYKTYDDTVLIKAADVGQMILVRDTDEPAPEGVEHKDGLTPAMKDARKRRFRREPEINPDYVHQVENDLLNIMAGGTAQNVDVEVVEQEEDDMDEPEPVPVPQPAAAKPQAPAAAAAAAAATDTGINKDKAPTAEDDDDSSDDENGYYEDSDEY